MKIDLTSILNNLYKYTPSQLDRMYNLSAGYIAHLCNKLGKENPEIMQEYMNAKVSREQIRRTANQLRCAKVKIVSKFRKERLDNRKQIILKHLAEGESPLQIAQIVGVQPKIVYRIKNNKR